MKTVKDLDFRLRVTPRGSLKIIEGEDVIKQSIKTILSTIPGERVRHPEFGSQVYSLLFEPMDDMTVIEIQDSIERALQNFENRIVLRRVRVIPNFNNNTYTIDINYFNNLTQRTGRFQAQMRSIEG